MLIVAASHLDHGLSLAHLVWLRALFADRAAFFLETVEIPGHLSAVECGLYGPLMGDEPIPEIDVRYLVRDNRKCASRVISKPVRKTRQLTVIAGPQLDDPCVLYTAYGGPAAPREPGDGTIPDWEGVQASRAFWAVHALSVPVSGL